MFNLRFRDFLQTTILRQITKEKLYIYIYIYIYGSPVNVNITMLHTFRKTHEIIERVNFLTV